MKKLILLGLLPAIASCGYPELRSPEDKPNIILIVADDLGAVDLNIYGSADLITPNLDRQALSGVRFSQFYSNGAVCGPSRASLLTGKYPQNAGLPFNPSSEGTDGLPLDQVTIAEALKANGYKTAIIGKWHQGSSDYYGPNNQGFDFFFGCRHGVIDYYSHFFHWGSPIHPRHDLWRNEEPEYRYGENFSDMSVDESILFMKKHRNDPFFLYIPFGMVHSPIQPEREYYHMYEHIEDPKRRNYAAFVTSFDDKVGKILAAVDDLRLRNNTIIFFMSDNGHDPGPWDWGGSAGPYRGAKSTHWEGGIRMPAFIAWEGIIPQAAVRDQVVVAMDLMPTLLEYTNTPFPEEVVFDGKSIRNIISSPDAPEVHDAVFWQLHRRWAVRKGPWKLVKHDNDDLFLANLIQDISESVNLIDDHPEITENLKSKYDKWRSSVGLNEK